MKPLRIFPHGTPARLLEDIAVSARERGSKVTEWVATELLSLQKLAREAEQALNELGCATAKDGICYRVERCRTGRHLDDCRKARDALSDLRRYLETVGNPDRLM